MNFKVWKKGANLPKKFGHLTNEQCIPVTQNQALHSTTELNCCRIELNHSKHNKMLQTEAERQRNTGIMYSNLYPAR